MLPDHKTKILATIGPGCAAADTLEKMIRAGIRSVGGEPALEPPDGDPRARLKAELG